MEEDNRPNPNQGTGMTPRPPDEPQIIESVPVTFPGEEVSEPSKLRVNLQTRGLAFEVQTQIPQNAQMTEMAVRLEIAQQQLGILQEKLESAMRRIGFLEAQVLQRDQVIDQLCKK